MACVYVTDTLLPTPPPLLPNKGIWRIIPNRRLFTNKGVFIAVLNHHLLPLLLLFSTLPSHASPSPMPFDCL